MNRPAPSLPSARDARRELRRGASPAPNLRPRVVIREGDVIYVIYFRVPSEIRRPDASRLASTPHRAASPPRAAKDDLLADLVFALATQARDKIQKDFNELVVEPFADPDPGPLPDLVPPSQLADPDSKFVAVDVRGTRVVVHYKEHVVRDDLGDGDADGKGSTDEHGVDALVCLHGANGSEFSFRRLLPRVAAAAPGTRCIAFDRPPYGLSTRPDPPGRLSGDGSGDASSSGVDFVYTAAGQAELTLALMDALGIRTAALLGHSAGAPVALDAALVAPERVRSYIAVAPAVFLGDPPKKRDPPGEKDDDGDAKKGGGGGGGIKLPLDRQLRFAWFRFLVSRDGPGLNVVRGSVRRQMAAIEEGRAYADLPPETKAAYTRPTRTENWDVGLLQLFRAGSFGGDGERLRGEMPKLAANGVKVAIVVGEKDRTTPPPLSEALRDALVDAGVGDVRYELMPMASHLPMEEEAGGVRERFEAIVVDVVSAL